MPGEPQPPGTWNCIFCAKPLVYANRSREHIIPNALGGRLKTTAATCAICNPTTGHEIDAALVKAFAGLAVLLDVPRERGDHPPIEVRDPETNLKYRLVPGEMPELVAQMTGTEPLQRGEDGVAGHRFSFVAPSLEAAQKLFEERFLHSKGRKSLANITWESRPAVHGGAPLTAVHGAKLKEPEALRAIAKMAVCFAQSRGVSLSGNSPALLFLRAGPLHEMSVGFPKLEILTFSGLPEMPVHHAIFVKKDPESPIVVAYVTLFSVYEFVVVLDEHSTADSFSHGYVWDVTSAQEINCSSAWQLPAAVIASFRGQFNHVIERAESRGTSLKHWIAHASELFAQRALSAAAREYMKRIDAGDAHEAAIEGAKREMARILAKRGLTIDSFEVTATLQTDRD